jgi:hypothetical protein
MVFIILEEKLVSIKQVFYPMTSTADYPSMCLLALSLLWKDVCLDSLPGIYLFIYLTEGLAMQPRLASHLPSFCFSQISTGITGMHHQV